jgi:hypothetical protein
MFFFWHLTQLLAYFRALLFIPGLATVICFAMLVHLAGSTGGNGATWFAGINNREEYDAEKKTGVSGHIRLQYRLMFVLELLHKNNKK